MKRVAAVLLTALVFGASAFAAPPPSDSLYQLATPLVTQADRPASLDLHRGQPVLISMFYASCPHVCPMLIAAMHRMERALDEGRRARLRVLLVSLNPDRDTPVKLRELAERHNVDLSRWTFARTSDREVRKLAAALGIQYRQLPDGEFNHATVITLLDAEGRVAARTTAIAPPDAEFVEALRRITKAN